MGDGAFARFDGPARAIKAAQSIVQSAPDELGIQIRAGVHTGECELLGDDLGGMAVHLGARIAAKAQGGEVLVSAAVRDLVLGSPIGFEDRGVHELKGIPGTWQLLAGHRGRVRRTDGAGGRLRRRTQRPQLDHVGPGSRPGGEGQSCLPAAERPPRERPAPYAAGARTVASLASSGAV